MGPETAEIVFKRTSGAEPDAAVECLNVYDHCRHKRATRMSDQFSSFKHQNDLNRAYTNQSFDLNVCALR